MKADAQLLKFIEAARAQGASDQILVGMLKSEGWPEDSIYQTLSAHYEKLTGLQVPASKRSGAAAKDAFLYLLAVSTLATWTIALGSLMFTLIDKWIPDPVAAANQYAYSGESYAIASSLASILVAFPIYLFVTRLILGEVGKHPEKLESGVRKWLTYIALLMAAGVMIGDLVTVLTYFLRGELTSRFILKALTAIVISGGVFWYYLVSLKRPGPEAANATE